jgi:hypothetical protein
MAEAAWAMRPSMASSETGTSSARAIPVVDAREVRLKGISHPVEIVTIVWLDGPLP